MYINQNLVKNTGNFGSGFFPDFPDPVFSRKKNVGEVGGGQTLGHFMGLIYIACFIYKLDWGMMGQRRKPWKSSFM